MSALAVDVGLRYLAHCFLRVEGLEPKPRKRKREEPQEWETVLGLAPKIQEGDWRVEPLGPETTRNYRQVPEALLLEWTAAYFQRYQHLFLEAGTVIIEMQKTCRLRVVAGGLFALVAHHRSAAGKSAPVFQHALRKLSWLHPQISKPGNYRERKAAAIRLCRELMEVMPSPFPGIFQAARKKDDLADALLHCAWVLTASTEPGLRPAQAALPQLGPGDASCRTTRAGRRRSGVAQAAAPPDGGAA